MIVDLNGSVSLQIVKDWWRRLWPVYDLTNLFSIFPSRQGER
jgi:hypothetical protein